MRRCPGYLLIGLLASPPLQAEDYSFDVSSFEKAPFSWGGYLELRHEHQSLDPDALLGAVTAASEERSSATLEFEADYNWNQTRLSAQFHTQAQRDDLGEDEEFQTYQVYLAHQQDPQLKLEAGKRSLRWGKGYAWNPVAFVERRKDPLDPDLSREGYVLAAADYIRSQGGALKTWAFTPVWLPVSEELNDDYGKPEDTLAAKLYLFYRDIDIDLLYRNEGSRPERIGLDFAANLASNFEVHGEWAHGPHEKALLDGLTLSRREETVDQLLLGLRYLSRRDTTYILEYYHNGEGYTEQQMQAFYTLLEDPATTPDLAKTVARAGYLQPQAMRNYLYLRISQKEPFQILYFTPGLTLIRNLDDRSYTLNPELLYTGLNNLELRLRAAILHGDKHSEFGARSTESKWELRLRYFY